MLNTNLLADLPISREMRTWSIIKEKTEICLKNTNSFWFWAHHQQSNKNYLFPSFTLCVMLQSLQWCETGNHAAGIYGQQQKELYLLQTLHCFPARSLWRNSHFILVVGRTFSIWPITHIFTYHWCWVCPSIYTIYTWEVFWLWEAWHSLLQSKGTILLLQKCSSSVFKSSKDTWTGLLARIMQGTVKELLQTKKKNGRKEKKKGEKK